jgi:hypothetical protein
MVSTGIPEGRSDGYVYANGIRIHCCHAVPVPGKPMIVMTHGATHIGLCWTTLTQDLQRGCQRPRTGRPASALDRSVVGAAQTSGAGRFGGQVTGSGIIERRARGTGDDEIWGVRLFDSASAPDR